MAHEYAVRQRAELFLDVRRELGGHELHECVGVATKIVTAILVLDGDNDLRGNRKVANIAEEVVTHRAHGDVVERLHVTVEEIDDGIPLLGQRVVGGEGDADAPLFAEHFRLDCVDL